MGILSDLIPEFNNQEEKLSDETVLLLGRWVAWATTIIGLDSEGRPNDPSHIGLLGLDILPELAKTDAYQALQLRDQVGVFAHSNPLGHLAIAKLSGGNHKQAIRAHSNMNYTIRCVLRDLGAAIRAPCHGPTDTRC